MNSEALLWSDPVSMRTVVSFITCIGLTISSLEWLVPWRKLSPDGLVGAGSFPINATQALWRTFGIRCIFVIRFVLAGLYVLCVIFGSGSSAPGWAMFAAGLISLPLRLRNPIGVFCGMDGAEHLMISICLTLGCTFFLQSNLSIEAALAFVAVQGLIEYTSAGWVKLRDWRGWVEGMYIRQVFRSSHYGDPFAAELTESHPRVSKFLSIFVLTFEAAMPLTLILPSPGAEILLLAALSFQIATARIMGLNTFFWAFTATYPAILHCREIIW